MTPEQCRAGRAWLNWTQAQLADTAGVALSTLKDFEGGRRVPIGNNLAAMRAALEKQGIGFAYDGDGKTALGISFKRPVETATG